MHHNLALKDPLDKVDVIWDAEAIAFSDSVSACWARKADPHGELALSLP